MAPLAPQAHVALRRVRGGEEMVFYCHGIATQRHQKRRDDAHVLAAGSPGPATAGKASPPPVWRQKPERMRAHIFVCFLGHVLWKVMEQWQPRTGLGNSPRTMWEVLGQVQSGDVVLPTMTGEELRRRCIARPEKTQQMTPQRLGVDLPRRMKVLKMQCQLFRFDCVLLMIPLHPLRKLD